ncbi:MAG TPA: hypothetical protein VMW69_05695 [Spirochaetia bacterium]|nr:hypothetical protein [Spirochaetia bacterium]
MNKLIFVLVVSLGSVLIGYLLRRLRLFVSRSGIDRAQSVSKAIKLISMFVLNPITILDSFWRLPLSSRGLLLLPPLGLLLLAVGAAGALVFNRLFKIPPERAASVFVSGMFTNIVSFGGLTAFVFFGYQGYGLVMLFNMFISFAYYAVGFPVSERIARNERNPFAISPKLLRDRPYLFIPLAAIAVGLALNLTHVRALPWLGGLSSFLVSFIAAILGLAIGMTLHFGKMRRYRREILVIVAIKFILIPAVMIPLGLMIGLQHYLGGLPFRVLCIISFMPVAFNSLVPPALYDFDLDLANSGWIVTTFALVIVLPALYFALAR